MKDLHFLSCFWCSKTSCKQTWNLAKSITSGLFHLQCYKKLDSVTYFMMLIYHFGIKVSKWKSWPFVNHLFEIFRDRWHSYVSLRLAAASQRTSSLSANHASREVEERGDRGRERRWHKFTREESAWIFIDLCWFLREASLSLNPLKSDKVWKILFVWTQNWKISSQDWRFCGILWCSASYVFFQSLVIMFGKILSRAL